MIEHRVEFECSLEVKRLVEEIDKLQENLKIKAGVNWSTLSYFYQEGGGSFWRFDWEHLWNRNNTDLKILLEQAIEAGRDWL